MYIAQCCSTSMPGLPKCMSGVGLKSLTHAWHAVIILQHLTDTILRQCHFVRMAKNVNCEQKSYVEKQPKIVSMPTSQWSADLLWCWTLGSLSCHILSSPRPVPSKRDVTPVECCDVTSTCSGWYFLRSKQSLLLTHESMNQMNEWNVVYLTTHSTTMVI